MSSSSGSVASGTGLVSGIDYSSLISKLRSANTTPITLLQNQESKIENQKSALSTISGLLSDFQTKAEALSESDSFLSMTATPSDYTVMSATADGTSSTEGAYSVTVKQLAQAHRIASQGVATSDSTSIASGSGTFQFKVGSSTAISVDVTSGMTLQELRDKINSADDSKVRATILNDGSTTNPYRLVLTSSETGQDNAITIVNNDTSLNLGTSTIEDAVASSSNTFNGTITSSGTFTGTSGRNIMVKITSAGAVGEAKYKVSLDGGVTWTANDAFTTSTDNVDVTGTSAEGVMVKFAAGTANFAVGDQFTIDAFTPELQKAQNAVVSVDGIQVSRSTNTIEDVIEGVSLTVKKATNEAETLTVQNSSTGVLSKITDFTTAYNTLVDTISKATAFDTDTKTAATLFGDSGVKGIINSLRSSLMRQISSNSTYKTLSSIGITMDKDGHLNADSSKVTEALKDNLSEVQKLFIEAGVSSNSSISLVKSTDATKEGSYQVNITTAAEQAAVVGGRALESTGLTTDETITVAYNDSAVAVTLTAGLKLDQIVDTLNAQFSASDLGVQASNEGGKLRISSKDYGSDQTISVYSNRDASTAGQLGIGTSVQSDTGVDVAGTINGIVATGAGQILKGVTGTDTEGMQLKITALAPTTGVLNLTHGVALSAVQISQGLTDSDTGLFATRNASYDARIKAYEKQIDQLNDRLDAEEDRLTKQFNDLEAKLSELQSEGNSLLTQLSALAVSTSSSS